MSDKNKLSLKDELGKLMKDMWGDFKEFQTEFSLPYPLMYPPKVDNGLLTLVLDVPGYEPSRIEVFIEDDKLVVEYRTTEEERKNEFRVTKDFTKSVKLPFEPDLDSISANTKLGVLTIKVPQSPQAKRKVPIKVS